MARRKKEENPVSLFPFLSILCCVIGVLTLLIAAVALGQIDSHKHEGVDLALQYQSLIEKNKQNLQKLEEYQKLNEESAAIRDLLNAAKEELERLKKEQEQRDKKQDQQKKLHIKLLAEANRARKRIEELEPELAMLRESIAELKIEVVKRKKNQEALVKIRPSGSGKGLQPVFVECTSTDVVLHNHPEKKRIRSGDLSKSKEFRNLLQEVKTSPKGTMIFLIRNDGVGTYYTARQLARREYVNNGKLVVIGQGKIDLSYFEKAG